MNPSFDASIPVLTEILFVADDAKVGFTAEALPLANEHAAIDAAGPTRQAPDDQAWNTIEQQLSERILIQLQQQLPIVLEQRIGEMLQGLSEKICADLQAGVASIVAQELAQLKTDGNKP